MSCRKIRQSILAVQLSGKLMINQYRVLHVYVLHIFYIYEFVLQLSLLDKQLDSASRSDNRIQAYRTLDSVLRGHQQELIEYLLVNSVNKSLYEADIKLEMIVIHFLYVRIIATSSLIN